MRVDVSLLSEQESQQDDKIKSGLTLFQLCRCVLVSHRYIWNDKNDTVCNERVAKRQLPSFNGGKTDMSLPTPAAPPESVCPKEPWVVWGRKKQNKHYSLVKSCRSVVSGDLTGAYREEKVKLWQLPGTQQRLNPPCTALNS